MNGGWPPSVDVVIPTRDRPEFVRAAIASVTDQVYGGVVSIIVVFDGEPPDRSLEKDGPVTVRVIANTRRPGLAGARNSGIMAATADLVAFLDDDDTWLRDKLSRQVAFRATRPEARLVSTAIRVDFGSNHTVRLAQTDSVDHERLLASRMSMLHSSTFLFDREQLIDEVGLIDEDAPAGQKEDWDILLRASRLAPLAHLDEPLVAVRWGGTSKFASAWRSKLESADWILNKHPDITTSTVGHARLLGQIAFAHAALRHRRSALRTAWHAAQVRWREPRGYLAVLVALGVPASFVQAQLHRFGRGI